MADRHISYSQVLGLSAAILGAVAVAGFVTYRTIIGPRLSFHPEVQTMVFERDALTGRIDPVPVDVLFAEENIEKYRDGSGFTATFRIHNDPEADGDTTETRCGVDAWTEFAQTSNPVRRELISRQETEFLRCVEEFHRELSLERSVEIGIDDTEGMNAELADFVMRTLSNEEVTTDRIFELTRTDAVRLVFFRLSNIEAYDQRLYPLEVGSSREEIETAWQEGLTDWLLQERDPRQQTSITRGVFNALSRGESIQKREIHIFSDGMENSPEVTSFYEILEDPIDYNQLDAEMSELIECPTPGRVAFELKWHFTPLDLPFYYRIRDYWEHVLTEVCKLPATAVLY